MKDDRNFSTSGHFISYSQFMNHEKSLKNMNSHAIAYWSMDVINLLILLWRLFVVKKNY